MRIRIRRFVKQSALDSTLDFSSSRAGDVSALWSISTGFTYFACPVVPLSGAFCLPRSSLELLEVLVPFDVRPLRSVGWSLRHRLRPGKLCLHADLCRLNLASQPGLPLPQPGNRPPQVRALPFPVLLPHLPLRLLVASDFVVLSQLVQPHSLMSFVLLRSQVCLRLPSVTASRPCPCLRLAVGVTAYARVFHPLANAHAGRTKKEPTKCWSLKDPLIRI
jgi:hypothetical protein